MAKLEWIQNHPGGLDNKFEAYYKKLTPEAIQVRGVFKYDTLLTRRRTRPLIMPPKPLQKPKPQYVAHNLITTHKLIFSIEIPTEEGGS